MDSYLTQLSYLFLSRQFVCTKLLKEASVQQLFDTFYAFPYIEMFYRYSSETASEVLAFGLVPI